MSSITDRFEYRAPTDGQVQDISLIRAECKVLASLLEKTPMEPRYRALALTKLRVQRSSFLPLPTDSR